MHDKRNLILIGVTLALGVWAMAAWLFLDPGGATTVQRWFVPGLALGGAVWLVYGLFIEDKLPDLLESTVGPVYFEVDGLDFMPTIRNRGDHAELCLYYQNRYEGPAEVVVHLRPKTDACLIEGARDVHFAFKAGGGDFGVIHQPISVPRHLAGEVIEVELGAAVHYPRSHGTRLRRHVGMPCGSMLVDWTGARFKTGVHQVSGDIELKHPARLHLSLPKDIAGYEVHDAHWRQECLAAGMHN